MSQYAVILALLGLVGAFRAGDREELAHQARRASAELAAAMAGDDRSARLAAAVAAPEAENAWVLLRPLARLAESRDRREASIAARSAARIAAAFDRMRLLERDIPADLIEDRLVAWREVARDRGRWADVRVHALETAAALYRALGPDAVEAPFDLRTTASDPDPAVRRAALELLPAPLPDELVPIVAARVTEDDDPAVALAAGEALCIGLALDADPAPLLAALGDAGLARLAELAGADDAAPAAAADARRCLAAARGGDAQ